MPPWVVRKERTERHRIVLAVAMHTVAVAQGEEQYRSAAVHTKVAYTLTLAVVILHSLQMVAAVAMECCMMAVAVERAVS